MIRSAMCICIECDICDEKLLFEVEAGSYQDVYDAAVAKAEKESWKFSNNGIVCTDSSCFFITNRN